MAADLSALDGVAPPDALVGMGGAVTNITAVMLGLSKYDPDSVQGSVIDRVEVDRQIERYRSSHRPGAPADRGLAAQTGRGDPGRGLHRAHGHGQAKRSSLSVSDRGLRHGLLIDRFGGRL